MVSSKTKGSTMAPRSAAQTYARIGIETGVASASPHGLVLMLYDGALRAIADADAHLATNRIPDKGAAISRAIQIIEQGLKLSLDPARGGVIAGQLGELYDYMNRRLLLASLRNDRASLAEVAQLLTELRSAWAEIANATGRSLPSAPRHATV